MDSGLNLKLVGKRKGFERTVFIEWRREAIFRLRTRRDCGDKSLATVRMPFTVIVRKAFVLLPLRVAVSLRKIMNERRNGNVKFGFCGTMMSLKTL